MLPVEKYTVYDFVKEIGPFQKIRGDRTTDTKVSELLSFHFCMLSVK